MKTGAPAFVERIGGVAVPAYRYGFTTAGKPRFCVVWQQTAGGKRIRETFTGEKPARERAKEIARAIADGLGDVLALSSADRDSYRIAVQALEPLGIPLHAAIQEYTHAREKLGKHSLIEAVNFFQRGHADRLACPPSAEILGQLIGELRDDRREVKKYVAPLQRDLARFVDAFPELSAADENAIREYLRGLQTTRPRRDKAGERVEAGAPVSARRRDNVRDSIVRLFRFARKKGFLPVEKTSPPELIPRLSEGGEVSTYSPAQLRAILEHFATTDPDFLPWAALGAFAGLRTSEIWRLEWSAFRWEAGAIAVSRSVARKVRVARQAPILLALSAWLAPWRAVASGPVIPRKWKSLEDGHESALARLKRALGWKAWDANALRHSFGSNRLAIVKSFAQVALEMGNSPEKVRAHYNDPKPESEAAEFFGILPGATIGNVIRFG